jgi:transposase
VNRPDRQHRRRYGKSDPADAVAAAKAVLSGAASGLPRCVDGPVEAVRNLSITRAGLVKARTRTANQIHALIVTAPNHLREQLEGQSLQGIARTVAALDTDDADMADPAGAVTSCLKTLTGLWAELGVRIKDLNRALDVATAAAAPPVLFDEVGVGAVVAAPLIVVAGTDPHRFDSDSSFAAACGVSAVDASSGKQIRHRLNRGGDRQANAALYRIVIVRLRYHQPTKHYMARRLAEGKTKRETIRMLKRYVARDIYKILTQPT